MIRPAISSGLAEASERDLRQDLGWDSPDDSRTGVNIIAFPSSLEDRREVRTATGHPRAALAGRIAVTPGTRSSISPGRSCPSRAAIGRAWVTQCEDWYKPGSKIGTFPFWSSAIFAACLSIQVTTCPKSEKQAPDTSPT